MIMWFVISWVLALLVACFVHWIYRWRNPKCNGVLLPPGSMGLPLIGETLQLMVPGYSLDLIPFMKKRIQRYGTIFRTSIAGRPIIVSADAKFNHFILQQDGKLFESWYLDTFAKIFAQEGASTNVANIHKYVRSMALNHFGVEALKEKLLPQLEVMIHETLSNWSCQASIDVKYASATMALEFGAKQLFSYDPRESSEKLIDTYFSLLQGLMSIPLNIPGTAYYKCMKDHKKSLNKIRDVLKQRQRFPEMHQKNDKDFLDHVIQDMNTEDFLTENFVVQLFFGLLYVSFDSLSTTITLTLKLLEEYPNVLQELIVINEALRLGNISPGLFRRSLTDIQVNGYTIPAGWGIMIATSALHLDSDIFKDPLAFNPWRWKDRESSGMLKNFMPFGGGMKQCAGSEYTRVFMATFLHVLVSKYRWTKIKGGEICRNPVIGFGKGLHIKVMEKHN